jgi:hypothetical protein
MAPKPEKPRLANIDPAMFGESVQRTVLDYLHRRAIDVGALLQEGAMGPSTLAHTAMLLCGYAQYGLRATDWPNDGCCQDALIEVMAALYSHAAERGTFGGGALDVAEDVDPDDDTGVVLLAANARQTIMIGVSMTPAKQLAALAGIGVDRVWELIRSGELRGEWRSGVPAVEAGRWLAARGVPGFAPITHVWQLWLGDKMMAGGYGSSREGATADAQRKSERLAPVNGAVVAVREVGEERFAATCRRENEEWVAAKGDE